MESLKALKEYVDARPGLDVGALGKARDDSSTKCE